MMETFSCPDFSGLDDEMIGDFYDSFVEAFEDIEKCCEMLESEPENAEWIHRLYRSLHSFKGNCRMVFLDPLVTTCHQMEEIVSEMRDGTCEYSPVLGEFFIAMAGRVDSLVVSLMRQGVASQTLLDDINLRINTVAEAPIADRVRIANRLLDDLAGAAVSDDATDDKLSEVHGQRSDLEYFYQIATALDGSGVFHGDRLSELVDMALKINAHLKHAVDADQLKAAMYVHKLGYALLPAKLQVAEPPFSHKDMKRIAENNRIPYEMLMRVPGWDSAAMMVMDHREHMDGSGFPLGKQGNQIHAGAQILAVLHAFQHLMTVNETGNYRRTLLKAVAEINSNSSRWFDEKVIDGFNLVVRERFVSKA